MRMQKIAICWLHWEEGELRLACTAEELAESLARLYPEWRDYIKLAGGNEIDMYTHTGRRTGDKVQILVPGAGNPNYEQAPGIDYYDLGMKQDAKGVWRFKSDASMKSEVDRLKKDIMKNVASQRMIRGSVAAGDKIVSDTTDKKTGKRVVRFISKLDRKKEIME